MAWDRLRPRMKRIMSRAAAIWLAEARGERPARWVLPLIPLGAVASQAVRRRMARFDDGIGVIRPALPVVSVGNLTVGGTNKTPTVDWLLGAMRRRGRDAGVLTRGYGSSNPPGTFRMVDVLRDGAGARERGATSPSSGRDANPHADGRAALAGLGDEPRLLATHHPEAWVAVDPDRVRGCLSLALRGADLAVADDAFQHRRLGRIFDLVLVDATCPWGNGRMLPAGILREPVEGLGRADAVLLTRSDEVTEAEVLALRRMVERWVPSERIHLARLERTTWNSWPGRPGAEEDPSRDAPPPSGSAFVITGIARPESLVRTLRTEGIDVCGRRVFRDHARVDLSSFREVEGEAERAGAAFLACTEKDLPNLPSEAALGRRIWYPRVGMSIERSGELLESIARALESGGGAGR